MSTLAQIREEMIADPSNAWARELGYAPIYRVAAETRVLVIGQAPGRKAQESGAPFTDASGDTLRSWLGVSAEQFAAPAVGVLPMDAFYPGRGKGGDLPPRPEFATLWHPRILAELPDVRLTVLVGRYAQRQYLGLPSSVSLTEAVRGYRDHLPLFPIVHPSPLNFRWQAKNPWFQAEVVPVLRELVADALRP
ncbi:uracil-DNA glycosylase family protein [Plantibacter sp. YIM 135347]|uniref:uracil-DNA glycosylase family protein n=1 Tax=Plantibacter sp. YIM 135347 TaxID=3423919 RepID=UPI003D346CF3